jgi:hypothetical protein
MAEMQPTLETSLFPSDQALLGDEAVAKILSSKLELAANPRLAIMKFPENGSGGFYGSPYWRSEKYLKLQQEQMAALTAAVLSSGQLTQVLVLPSLMTPNHVTLPVLREAAVRMQADLLLIFRIGSDSYWQNRLFSKDKVKAYSTCEIVLLDTRTGLVPFTRVVSREKLEFKQPEDLDLSETSRRAELVASTETLASAGEDLAAFLRSVPKKSH